MTNLSQTLKAFRERFLNPDLFSSRSVFHPKYDDGKIGLMAMDLETFIAQSIKSACEEMIVEEIQSKKYADPFLLEKIVETYKEGYKQARQDQLERLKNILG